MTEREKYIEQITQSIPDRDVLEAIAEEATEVAHAALKIIRAGRLSKNVTPVKAYEAQDKMLEEILDLLLVLDVLGLDLEDAIITESNYWKWQRWAERLEDKAND